MLQLFMLALNIYLGTYTLKETIVTTSSLQGAYHLFMESIGAQSNNNGLFLCLYQRVW